MTVPNSIDSLLLDRRAVAAHYHGRLPELLAELHGAGHAEVTLGDLEARAEVMAEAWRVGDPDKGTCYLCRAETRMGALCACYDEVVAKRHYNVNEPKILARLAPETVVETIICQGCGDPAPVTAESALSSHTKNKAYRSRKYCRACFSQREKKPRHAKRDHTAPLMEAAQAATKSGEA